MAVFCGQVGRVHWLIRSGTAKCPACGALGLSCRPCWPPRRRARRNTPRLCPRSRRPARADTRRTSPTRSTTGAGCGRAAATLRRLCPFPDRQSRTGRTKSKMRRWAEKAMRPGENAADGHRLLRAGQADRPATAGRGSPKPIRRAARTAEALDAARNAWASDDLGASDEQAMWARFGGSFTARRPRSRASIPCCSPRRRTTPRASFPMASPQRQAAFARPDRHAARRFRRRGRYRAVIGTVTSDAGLMMDRARYLRGKNYDHSARDLAARAHKFVYRPADAERFYDMLLLLANDAAQDRQWQTAYNIASQIDDALPTGTDVSRSAARRARQLHEPGVACRKRRARPAPPCEERDRDV